MRKYMLLGWIVLCMLLLVACNGSKVPQESDMPPHDGELDWGITITPKDITPEGMTWVISQSGGNVTGELLTGSKYVIEKFVRGEWKEFKPIEEILHWNDLAYIITLEGTTELEVDWSDFYGAIPAGSYRVGKEIKDFREAGGAMIKPCTMFTFSLHPWTE